MYHPLIGIRYRRGARTIRIIIYAARYAFTITIS